MSRKIWHFLGHGGRVTYEDVGRRKRIGNSVYVPFCNKSTAQKRCLKFHFSPVWQHYDHPDIAGFSQKPLFCTEAFTNSY